ncbi:exosome nuclease subunit [Serendipita sp. 399]|nr:exosome nuclease subunit [Serendipita sp. 399]
MTSAVALESSVEEYTSLLKIQADSVFKAANELPKDIRFHRSLDGKFKTDLDAATSRALKLTNRLLRLIGTETARPADGKVQRRRVEDRRNRMDFEDEQDVIDRFHSGAVDLMDPLFERVDHCLDVYNGKAKPMVPSKITTPAVQADRRLPQHLLHAYKLAKPQLKFQDQVNNAEDAIWRHKIKQKWNRKGAINETDSFGGTESNHPYFHEISTISYPPSLFASRPPIPPKSFEETPFGFIDTLDGLENLLKDLRNSEEIAIDLEHHSYRSYHGFVCLMQISNRSQDWIVDCLIPEIRSNLELLNEVFHGAGHDIVWLQGNFNLYIVNLFDTYHASRVLEFPKFSLAYLLSKYCDFTADKRYQLADWRIRPLPEEMMHYARSDTHFLLFIYDNLREALLQTTASADDTSPYASMTKVLKNSGETSLKEAAWEVYDAINGEGTKGWAGLIRKFNKPELTSPGPSRDLFLAIHRWRDRVAREEDESPLFVASNQNLLAIVEKPPNDLASLYELFGNFVPALVRKRGAQLLEIIQNASINGGLSIDNYSSINGESAVSGRQDAEMMDEVVQPLISSTKSSSIMSLWPSSHITVAPTSNLPVTRQSSLFRSILAPPAVITHHNQEDSLPQSTSLLTRTSVLLGNRPLHASGPGSHWLASQNPRTVESISRIHDGILESQRKVVTIQTKADRSAVTVPPNKKSETQQTESISRRPVSNPQIAPQEPPVRAMEIEFVPQSKRNTITDNDDIVVIGNRKQKRRRLEGESDAEQRKKNRYSRLQGPNSGSDPMERSEDISSEGISAFDYDANPNILDEGMKKLKEEGQSRVLSKNERKESHRNQGKKLDVKEFGRAPRRTNDPKSGNKSITYR